MANRNFIASDYDLTSFGRATAVTKSDDTVLVGVKGLWIGGTGNVVVEMSDGVDVTFTAVAAGELLPIRVNKVKAATTATNIVALY